MIVAFGLVLLFALDALVLRPVGGVSLALRALRLVGIAAVGVGLAFAWSRLGGRTARALICLGVGVGALAVGAAVTGTRVARGFELGQITGIASLLAALFLIGVGWARLFARRPWWRPVLGVAAALVAFEVVLLPLVISVYATNAPRAEAGPRTPADVGLPFEEVHIESSDGTQLSAWSVPSENGAAILLLHGSGSTRDDMLDHAAMLGRRGYGLLLLDARGHGASGGEPMEFGWGSDPDIRAAVDYLVARSEVDAARVGVLGASMGGEQAITAAATDERLRAVVADGASGRTFGDAAEHPELVGGWIGIPGAWVQFAVTDLLADASPPIPLVDAIAAIAPRPVLLIAGEERQEAAANPNLAEAGGPTVELWELPDTGHIAGVRTHPEEYERRVVGFFDAALGA